MTSLVIDGVRQHINLTTNAIKKLADRNLNIGCDQVLLIEPPSDKNIDFNYRIFNCDGSRGEQCGNGARCMGRYIADQQLSGKKTVLLQTKNRIMEVTTKPKNLVTANMGTLFLHRKKYHLFHSNKTSFILLKQVLKALKLLRYPLVTPMQ